jgi:hypothetical protein
LIAILCVISSFTLAEGFDIVLVTNFLGLLAAIFAGSSIPIFGVRLFMKVIKRFLNKALTAGLGVW